MGTRKDAALLLILVFLPLQFPEGHNSWAHDLLPPEGRGRVGTTYQHWRFDTAVNPVRPEAASNPYGDSLATIVLGDFGEGWYDTVAFGSMTGVWDMGRSGTMTLDISNISTQVQSMEIRVQVTYFESITGAPSITVENGGFISGRTIVVEEDALGEWLLYQGVWQISPGQARTTITLTSAFNGSVIDQVVVDTAAAADCFVDYEDVAVLHEHWLEEGGEGTGADLNGSGGVNLADFAVLAAHWLNVCPANWPLE